SSDLGFSRGLAIHELKDGEEIAEILFEISGYDNLKLDVPFTLDISDLNKLASDEPTTLYDELELLREEYLSSRFDSLDGEEISRSEEHTSELQSRENLVCRLLLEKKNKTTIYK